MKGMKKTFFIIVGVVIIVFALAEANSTDVDQNATVLIGFDFDLTQKVNGTIAGLIDVSLNPPNADFGLLYPGESKSINVTVNNTKSNVNITVDSVGLLNRGTLFDGLLFNGQNTTNFVPLNVDAWGTGLIILTLNVPDVIEPGPQGDTIVYIVTGPIP